MGLILHEKIIRNVGLNFKKVIKKLGKELLIFNYRYAILLIEQMFEK